MDQHLLRQPARIRARIALGLATSAACLSWVVCHEWDGHHSLDLDQATATEIAIDPNVRADRRTLATAAVRRATLDGVAILKELSSEPDPVGAEARAALQHIRIAIDR